MRLPPQLDAKDTESFTTAAGVTVCVPKTMPTYPRWHGPMVGPTFKENFGGKALLDYAGTPLFAELYTLRLLTNAGWDGAWVNSFGRVFLQSYSPRVVKAIPAGPTARLAQIAGTDAFPSGWWDVFAWRDESVLFAECKLSHKDRIRPSQLRWLQRAIAAGVPVDAFRIVEWTLSQ